MKCCGVMNADDWRTNVTNPGWEPSTSNKPLGCCYWKKNEKVCRHFCILQLFPDKNRKFLEGWEGQQKSTIGWKPVSIVTNKRRQSNLLERNNNGWLPQK